MQATRRCTIPGCDRPHKGRGLCDLHRQRLNRTGTTDSPVTSLEARFWAKVDRRGPAECWPWTAATNAFGYGVIRPEGQRSGPYLRAHRVSLALAGVQVEGYIVRHKCDNPPCVNPAHLEVGTKAQNTADMLARGRHRNGRRLTEVEVYAIRELWRMGFPRKAIAAHFGVSGTNVTSITRRKTWRDLNAVTPPAARDLVAAIAESLGGAAA